MYLFNEMVFYIKHMGDKCGEKWKNMIFDLEVFILYLGKRHKKYLNKRQEKNVLQNSIGLSTG